MDLSYDESKEILTCYCQGPVFVAEFKATIALIVSSKEYSPSVNMLWDVQDADPASFDISLAGQIVSIRQHYPERGNAKLAIVASDDLHFGLSRMYESMSDDMPQDIHVFRTVADAEQWLLR